MNHIITFIHAPWTGCHGDICHLSLRGFKRRPVQTDHPIEWMWVTLPDRLSIVDSDCFLSGLLLYPNRSDDRQQTRPIRASSPQPGAYNTNSTDAVLIQCMLVLVYKLRAPNLTSYSLKTPNRSFPTCLQRCTPSNTHTHTHTHPYVHYNNRLLRLLWVHTTSVQRCFDVSVLFFQAHTLMPALYIVMTR